MMVVWSNGQSLIELIEFHAPEHISEFFGGQVGASLAHGSSGSSNHGIVSGGEVSWIFQVVAKPNQDGGQWTVVDGGSNQSAEQTCFRRRAWCFSCCAVVSKPLVQTRCSYISSTQANSFQLSLTQLSSTQPNSAELNSFQTNSSHLNSYQLSLT